MPLNIWTRDQVPEMTLAGGQSLARGVSGAGHSVGDAIGKYKDREKQKEEELKETRAMAGIMADSLGMTKSDVLQADAATLKGMISGHFRQNDELSKTLAQEYTKLHTKSLQQQMAMEEMAGQNAANELPFLQRRAELLAPQPPTHEEMQDFYEGPPGGGSDESQRPQPKPAYSRDIATSMAAAQSGYRPDLKGVIDDLMKESTGTGSVDWEMVKPREFTTPSGARGVYGKGGQFQFIPEATGATKAGRVPIGEAPKVEGYDLLPTDQGGWRYARKPGEKAVIDLKLFDANKDGRLTGEEWAKAMLAVSMNAKGMPYDGMPVGNAPAAAPAAPAAGDSIYDRFKTWRGK